MKTNYFYLFTLILLMSCGPLFEGRDYNEYGFRDGNETGLLINDGSLVGEWEQTCKWNDGDGEFPASWDPVNIISSEKYTFLDNNTFTSKNTISNCLNSSGTYTIEATKIILIYNCEPNDIKEILINEFFFREQHIVFIKGEGTSNISKFEFVQ